MLRFVSRATRLMQSCSTCNLAGRMGYPVSGGSVSGRSCATIPAFVTAQAMSTDHQRVSKRVATACVFKPVEFQRSLGRTARTFCYNPHGTCSTPAIIPLAPPGLITPLARSIQWLEGKAGGATFSRFQAVDGLVGCIQKPELQST